MLRLYQIQTEIQHRTQSIEETHGNWPCRKGCADCCRRLASEPRVSRDEWLSIAAAIDALPRDVAAAAYHRIRESASMPRPVVCALLGTPSSACLIYHARPLACRAYGFYADRHEVLGCNQIDAISRESSDVIWGNHRALEDKARSLGPAKPFSTWLDDPNGVCGSL